MAGDRYIAVRADYTDDDTDGPFKVPTSDDVIQFNDKVGLSPTGALLIKYTNKTGSATVRGTLVKADTGSDDGVILTGANDQECIGAVYQVGVADGSEAWIAVGGRVQVLLKNTTGSSPGNWVQTSDTAGRADGSNAVPPGGGVVQLDEHMQECGHSVQTVVGGTNVLLWINMHFN